MVHGAEKRAGRRVVERKSGVLEECIPMQAHRTIAIVSENGSVTIEKLPFPAGKPVEVVVFPAEARPNQGARYPLRGTPIQFVDPTEPVAESDWEAQR